MLTSILPGFRHVRTPLITGALYLILVWVLLGSERIIPRMTDGSLATRRLAELADLVGRGPILAATSLAAVLVGSLLTVPRWRWWPDAEERPKFTSWDDMPAWSASLYGWAGRRTEWINRVPPSWRDLAQSRHISSGFIHALERESPRVVRPENTEILDEKSKLAQGIAGWADPDPATWAGTQVVNMALSKQVLEELDLLAARLQVEKDNLYNEYDRLRSEAELRFSMLLPLTLLMITFAFTWDWTAIVGVAFSIALFAHGIQSQRESRRIVVAAVVNGVVESPTAQGLERFKEEWFTRLERDASAQELGSGATSRAESAEQGQSTHPSTGPGTERDRPA